MPLRGHAVSMCCGRDNDDRDPEPHQTETGRNRPVQPCEQTDPADTNNASDGHLKHAMVMQQHARRGEQDGNQDRREYP